MFHSLKGVITIKSLLKAMMDRILGEVLTCKKVDCNSHENLRVPRLTGQWSLRIPISWGVALGVEIQDRVKKG